MMAAGIRISTKDKESLKVESSTTKAAGKVEKDMVKAIVPGRITKRISQARNMSPGVKGQPTKVVGLQTSTMKKELTMINASRTKVALKRANSMVMDMLTGKMELLTKVAGIWTSMMDLASLSAK